MTNRTCSLAECDRPLHARELCETHYRRFRKSGTTDLPAAPSLTELLWQQVEYGENDCWLWTGYKNQHGYGRITHKGVTSSTHRVNYELMHGPIPDGMQVDHLCFVPACLNPDHLRIVTAQQNQEHRSGPTSASKSRVRGVVWDTARRKWAVYVGHEGKTKNCGRFDSLAEAQVVAIRERNAVHTHNDLDR